MKENFYFVLFGFVVQFFVLDAFSQRGKVLSLDGTSGYMVVADKPELNINTGQGFSITCWVNTPDFLKRIISKRVSGGGAGYEFIDNSSPGGQFGVNLRSTTLVNAGPPFGTSNIANVSWHHLAMVVNAADSTCRIYVDGVQQQMSVNASIGSGSFANTVNLFFGTTASLTSFMNVQMDDIRIWSTALSANAVQSDMTTVVSGTEASLVAAWDFENVAGATVPDITTGNNHPGTLNGGASISTLPAMQYSSTTLAQTQLPAGRGDTAQRIIAVNVTTTGSANPISLTSLSLTMAGTTNIADVTKVKIYYTGSNSRFNTNTLFATAVPSSGTITANGGQTLTGGSNYFWIAYDLSATATEGNQLDATCESIAVGGAVVNFTPPNNAVPGSRTVLLAHKLLFSPGDFGSANYRIPAIITAADGSLVTVTDKRWNGSGDLSAKIDPVVRRSTDNGQTWSAPVTIANFGAAGGAGDACLVLDKIKNPGTLICVFAANRGFFASTPGNPINIQYCKSTDNGITWTAPTDITSQVYGSLCSNSFTQTWNAAFVASGRMHQLRSGRIAAVLAVRQTSAGTVDNFMIYSDDGGTTWAASTADPATHGIAAAGQANEAKLVELNNGNLMMSTRHPGSRLISNSGDVGATWGSASSQPQLVEPGCNGDFIRYTSTKDGFNKDRLLHSIPYNSATRQNVSVLVSYDEGASWPVQKTIFPLASAYSSLTVLNDGTIGMYYENGENGDIYNMYFARFSLSWLTNGADTYILPNGNVPPTVSIASPANNATFAAGSNINISATAGSPNAGGSIKQVDFYQGTTLLGTDTTPPYNLTWSNVAAGVYSLTAKATDNGSLANTSSPVTITVNAGPTGNVLSLNGTQYMYVNDHPDINIGSGQSKTITAWVKSPTVSSIRIMSKRAASYGAGYEFITSATGVFGLNAKTTSGAGLGAKFTSTPNVEDGKWHHVAMVVDQTAPAGTTGKFVKEYVDGVLVSTGPLFDASADFTNTVNLIVGGISMGTPAGQFAGSVDNVRIWNKPMTATDIATDMNAMVSGPATGLLAGWDFEKVVGTNVPDISGNNHPGVLVNNLGIVPASSAGIGTFGPFTPMEIATSFSVVPLSNPGQNSFTLQVSGGGSEKMVTTTIMDISGRLISIMTTAPGVLIRFGHDLKAGVYFVKVIQGTNAKMLKLVKL
jgi:hypothetical protein